MTSKLPVWLVPTTVVIYALLLMLLLGLLVGAWRNRAGKPASIEASAVDPDPLFNAMRTVAAEKFPRKPAFGDIAVDFSTKEVSFLGQTWKRQSEPAANAGFLRFGMKVWEFISNDTPDWRLLYAEISNPSIEQQFHHAWWFQKKLDGEWSDLGLKKHCFKDGDIWEFFYRTPISYVQNCWEGDGSKGHEYDIDNRISPPKYDPNLSPEFIGKLTNALAESKTPHEQALNAWYYPLTHINTFQRFGASDPPIDVTASLADSPADWSVCVVERQFSGKAPEDKFSAEDKLHSVLFEHNWFPLREALEEIEWPKRPFTSGKSDVLEWTFVDESDKIRHRLVFRFRMIRR